MRVYIKYPFAVGLAVLVVLFFDGTGVVFACLVAMLLHEGGHAAAYAFCTRKAPVFRIGFGGIALFWNESGIRSWHKSVIILAGPLSNLFVAAVCLLLCRTQFRFEIFLFGASNALLGGFNLLPLGFLDGGRLAEMFLSSVLSVNCALHVGKVLQWGGWLLLCWLFLAKDGISIAKIALLCFFCYFCCKSFWRKN